MPEENNTTMLRDEDPVHQKNDPEKNKHPSRRGFASMDEARRSEIASEGGRAAHERGTAHEFSSEEAREAGRKGGEARGNQNNSNR